MKCWIELGRCRWLAGFPERKTELPPRLGGHQISQHYQKLFLRKMGGSRNNKLNDPGLDA